MSDGNYFRYDYKTTIDKRKKDLREKINKDIKKFIKNGGKIKEIKQGISGQNLKIKDGKYVI